MSNGMEPPTEDLFHPSQPSTGSDEDESIPPTTITRTNTLVASTLIESSPEVQSHTIELFLDLIHSPDFDKSALTLHTSDEVLAYHAHVRQLRAAKRSDVPPATRQFPFSVVTNIIDIVESERSAHFSGSQDALDPVTSTLSDLSLVHRSWTWSAQKAIGRRLTLATCPFDDEDSEAASLFSLAWKALISPLFGAWTHSVYIQDDSLKSSEQETLGRRNQPETVQILATLFERLPRIHSLRLSTDVFTHSLTATSTLVPHLKALTGLRCLTLPDSKIHSSYTLDRFVDMLHVASHLPGLIRLKVGRWGHDSQASLVQQEHMRKIEQVTAEQAPTTLNEISLTISPATPLKIVSWLFDPYKNTSSSTARLEKVHLSIGTIDVVYHHHYQYMQVPGQLSIMEYVSAISPAQSFTHITDLSLSFTREHFIPELAILSFLEASVQLRTLSIYHGHNVAVLSIVRALPSTLEEFTYKLDMPHEQFTTFEVDISREITAPSFRATHQSLRSIALSVTEEFTISLVPIPTTNLYTLHWESPKDQQQAIGALPVPTIANIRQACESAQVRLVYSYGRSAASVRRPFNSSAVKSDTSYTYRSPTAIMFVEPITPVTMQP